MALTPLTSKIITDTGISLGDEGKGRAVLEIAAEICRKENDPGAVEMVAKVNGGANSGHTAAGLKLNLLPCGVAAKDVKILALGSGVVADPHKLLWEARPLEAKGYSVLDRLMIDERTMVSDVLHRLLDLAFENYRVEVLKEEPRGSTGRGITPAYCEETGQTQIFYADYLAPKEDFARKIKFRAERAVAMIQHVCQVSAETWSGFFETLSAAEKRANAEAIKLGVFTEDVFDFSVFAGAEPFTVNVDTIVEKYWAVGQILRNKIVDVRMEARRILDSGHYILGEFGQSFWLDKRHGFTPNVTASHTFTPEVFQSLGLPVQPVHNIGVCKAYDTKVGTHTFLTQLTEEHALGKRLMVLEFGTTTGRQRMVGWFDAVEKGDAIRFGGVQDLMINKIDVLGAGEDWSGELKICTHYEDEAGQEYRYVPRNEALRKRLKPVYISLPTWIEDISPIRSFADLPENARVYIGWMVKATLEVAYQGSIPNDTELPNVRYIGVGPDPDQIISDLPDTRSLLKEALELV